MKLISLKNYLMYLRENEDIEFSLFITKEEEKERIFEEGISVEELEKSNLMLIDDSFYQEPAYTYFCNIFKNINLDETIILVEDDSNRDKLHYEYLDLNMKYPIHESKVIGSIERCGSDIYFEQNNQASIQIEDNNSLELK